MTKPKLTYFDTPTSRGEECRLALHLAGIEFEDHRISYADWPLVKTRAPFGTLPILYMPGQKPLAQSNAILVLIGRLHGLHPKDDFEAARHEAMMQHVEDFRAKLSPTVRIKDPLAKKAARETLAANYLPEWAANVEKHLGAGPFFGGSLLQVTDLKLLMALRWVESGILDHVPKTIFDGYPKLNRLRDAVNDHEGVRAWHAKK